MALDKNDKQYIQDTIIAALEQVVLPRFDEIDRRFDEHDRRFDAIEKDLAVVKEDVRVLKEDMRQVKSTLYDLDGRAEALENDIRELYKLQTGHDNIALTDKKFSKLPLEEKILVFNTELLKMAEQAGVTLPR